MAAGSFEASRRAVMCVPLVTEVPSVVRKPLSFQMAAWESKMWKAYLESV